MPSLYGTVGYSHSSLLANRPDRSITRNREKTNPQKEGTCAHPFCARRSERHCAVGAISLSISSLARLVEQLVWLFRRENCSTPTLHSGSAGTRLKPSRASSLTASLPRSGFVIRLEFAIPDIAIAHRVSVILKHERSPRRLRRVFRKLPVTGVAEQFRVIVDHHAVVQHGKVARLHQFAILKA